MHFDTFKEIMDYAVEKEREAAEFYDELSRQGQFSNIKDIFSGFAKEEKRHQSMLQDFTKKNLEYYKIEKIPNLKRTDYLVDITYEPGMPYSDILILAAKREEKALKFYSDLSENTHKQEHKALFRILAQEEAQHKLRLETMLDDHMAEMGD